MTADSTTPHATPTGFPTPGGARPPAPEGSDAEVGACWAPRLMVVDLVLTEPFFDISSDLQAAGLRHEEEDTWPDPPSSPPIARVPGSIGGAVSGVLCAWVEGAFAALLERLEPGGAARVRTGLAVVRAQGLLGLDYAEENRDEPEWENVAGTTQFRAYCRTIEDGGLPGATEAARNFACGFLHAEREWGARVTRWVPKAVDPGAPPLPSELGGPNAVAHDEVTVPSTSYVPLEGFLADGLLQWAGHEGGQGAGISDAAPPPVVGRATDVEEPDGEQPSNRIAHTSSGVWEVTFAGVTVTVPDRAGFADLALLIERQGTGVPAMELYNGAAPATTPGDVHEGLARWRADEGLPATDEATLRDIRRRLEVDPASFTAEERDEVEDYLRRNTDRHGRPRLAGGRKAPRAVQKRLREAADLLRESHPQLWEHLGGEHLFDRTRSHPVALQTGKTCRYAPEPPVAWEVLR